MTLEQQALGAKIADWGGDKWAVANLAPYAEALTAEYGDRWQPYPRAISIGVYFPRQIVNDLLDGPTRAYLTYYDALCARLDDLSYRVANYLEKEGFSCYPIPASQREGVNKLTAIFSHRTAAYLAGLGWLGRSGSLVTPEVGPRVRLTTILTDAPLECGEPCANFCPPACTACRDICPAQAICGEQFAIGQPIEQRVHRAACSEYLREVRMSFGKEVCGKCLAACPWGSIARKHQ